MSGRLGRSDEDRPILSEDPVRGVRHDRAHCGVDLRPLRLHRRPTADWRFPEEQSGDRTQHCRLERRPDRPPELFGPPVHHRPIRRDLRHLLRLRRGRESVPDELLADYKDAKDVYERALSGLGNFSEVTAGILAGEAGYVHVGMDKNYIALQVQTAI